MSYRKTDLAYERSAESSSPSLSCHREMRGKFCLHVATETEKADGSIPVGRHVTLLFPKDGEALPDYEGELSLQISRILREEGARLLGDDDFSKRRVLFIGLGNAAATADAFGPITARHIRPTAQIEGGSPALFSLLSCAALAIFCPGVSSACGMESTALLSAVISAFHPELLLIADSLVAADPAHLGRAIQFSDSGIRPGGGIGCHGEAIDRFFAGCPVLSIGLPTAVHVSTLLRELGVSDPPSAIGEEHYLSPASVDRMIDGIAREAARAVETTFGLPY